MHLLPARLRPLVEAISDFTHRCHSAESVPCRLDSTAVHAVRDPDQSATGETQSTETVASGRRRRAAALASRSCVGTALGEVAPRGGQARAAP
jgi:hypothetical protein